MFTQVQQVHVPNNKAKTKHRVGLPDGAIKHAKRISTSSW